MTLFSDFFDVFVFFLPHLHKFLVNIVEGSELTSFIYRQFEQKSIKQEEPLLKTGVSGHSFHCFLLSGKKKTGGE